MRLTRFIVASSITTIVLAVVATLFLLFSPLPIHKEGETFFIKPGSSRGAVIKLLSRNGYIRLGILFNIYVHINNGQIKAGEYFFAPGSTPISIWKQITSGTGYYYHSFTIIPGQTFKQIREELAEKRSIKSTSQLMSDKDIMSLLGDDTHEPEGMFYAETYFYQRGDVDLTILKRAYDLMQSKLNDVWQNRDKMTPYKTPYEALIAASLIEKEAYLNSERSIISGVLVNRLRKDMLLQFDPSVIYGMGDKYNGTIYQKDLVADTPYNTYVRKGLPPTPIAIPSGTSIKAALHPKQHDYYYFVARGDGSHEFSKTLKAHQKAVKKAAEYRDRQSINTSLIRAYLQHTLAKMHTFSGRKHASR